MSSFFTNKLDIFVIFAQHLFMKITNYILSKIDRLPKGYIFTYNDFMDEANKKEAVIKGLNRMAEKGKIAKLSKGKFYKPENTPFGDLRPDFSQMFKDILEEDGKITGYLTGYSIYNRLGLTTQVSNTVQIGKNEIRPEFKRERYTISFIKQRNKITKENIPLLQILDAVRYIKNIPDTSIDSACKRLLAILKSLSEKDTMTLVRLALKYPPSAKALTGAMLDELNQGEQAAILYKTLNPITKYKIGDIAKVLTNAKKWNIV